MAVDDQQVAGELGAVDGQSAMNPGGTPLGRGAVQAQQDDAMAAQAGAREKLAEVEIRGHQHAQLGERKRQNRSIIGRWVERVDQRHVVPQGPQRAGKARVGAFVEQWPHTSASATVSSASQSAAKRLADS